MADERPKKKPVGGELIIPGAALLFTLYYFSTIVDVPWTAQVSAFFVGAILIFLILVFFVRTGLSLSRGEASLQLGRIIEPVSFIPRRIILFLITIGFIVLIELGVGFTITTFLFLVSAMLLLKGGKDPGFVVLLSTLLSIGGWLLFVVAFDTQFPEGPFEQLMKGMF